MPLCQRSQRCEFRTKQFNTINITLSFILSFYRLLIFYFFYPRYTGEGHKAAKEKVRNDATAGVAKVIGVSKLKTKYESFESKRQLCNSYDLFVADDRILPSLPKLLGKTFFKKKKQPVPVKLTGKDWAAQIRKACEATYLHLSGGSSLNIRVARSSQEEDECVENVMAVLEQAAEKLPGKWKGIKSLYLRTAESVALPVYQAEVEVEAAEEEKAK